MWKLIKFKKDTIGVGFKWHKLEWEIWDVYAVAKVPQAKRRRKKK